MSYLWVLGAYELVRTIDDLFRKNPGFVCPDVKKETERVKQLFARLRVPLVKLQPAHSHKSTDFSVPTPAVQGWRGAAWEIAPEPFVARRDLSDALLSLFKEISACRHATT